ncbi:MAG: PKD domain-containing protein [Acidobacteria bacterium]|nr:MAG: PKD domain-containing protein [Acidobacteriota bacterium]REK09288.1 MAG: PKD domain-containing protein [Acidobacteriota bacterium]
MSRKTWHARLVLSLTVGGILLISASLASGGGSPLATPGPEAPVDPVPLQLMSLSGTASGDEGDGFVFGAATFGGGESLLYSWDFGDGTAPMVVFDRGDMNHRYMDDGTYELVVTVDGIGESVEGRMTVEVKPKPPKIGLLVAERVGGEDGESRFQFSAVVTDPGDDDLVATWEFGDGSPPRTGEDLFDVEHTYERDGRYVLTLTVQDEDELTATKTRVITVGNSIHVDVSGDVSAAIRTGNGPVYACVTPLGDGGCGVHLQYWDDVNRSYLFLQNYANPILKPHTYPMVAADQRRLAEGAPIAESTGIVSAGMRPEDYDAVQSFLQITACDPSQLPSFDVGSLLQSATEGGLRQVGRRLLRSLPGGGLLGRSRGADQGPPTGGGWVAESGQLEITGIDERGIRGTVDAVMVAKQGRRRSTVEVEGSFSAVFEDHVQPFLGMCEDEPFEIAERHPEPDAERVFFGDPDVYIEFTKPVDRDTVDGDTVRLEVKKKDGSGFDLVPTRKLIDSETRRVHLVPYIELDPAKQHRVLVSGGQGGVRSRTGEQLGADDEWKWTTLIDLYRRPEREGQAWMQRSVPTRRSDVRVARAFDRGGAPRIGHAVWRAQNPLPMLAQNEPIMTSRGEIEASVECEAIQVAAGRPLVTDKTTMFRVDLAWEQGDVTSLPSGTVKSVTVQDGDCESDCLPLLGTEDNTYLPSRWYHPDRIAGDTETIRKAEQSAQIFGWPASRHLSSVEARVVIVDNKGREYVRPGNCKISHWEHGGEPVDVDTELRIDFYRMPLESWPVVTSALDINRFLGGSLSYVKQNLPVSDVRARLFQLLEEGPPENNSEVVLLPESSAEERMDDRAEAMMLRLQRTLKAQGLLFDADVIALVNSDRMEGEGWAGVVGVSYYYKADGSRDEDFETRLLQVAYDQGHKSGSPALAHEIGHSFDLRHRDAALIDGFRIFGGDLELSDSGEPVVATSTGFHKHSIEGNGEGRELKLHPVMRTGSKKESYGRSELFVSATYYDTLMENMGRYFLERAAAEQ